MRVIVTPRMHGIHHADVEELTRTNFSSLLSWWDMLHHTLVVDVPQDAITIGVSGWSDPRELTMGKLLAMPFGRQRSDWLL